MTFWRSASKQRLAMLDHIALMRFVLAECGQTEHALFGELSEKARLLSEEVEVSTIEMARRLVEIEEAMRAEFPSQFELDLSGSLNVTEASDTLNVDVIPQLKWREDKKLSRPLPPTMGEALLVLFCPKNRVDAVIGDLEERFHEHIKSKGKRRARLLYWAAVLRSIGPVLWIKLRRAGLIALLLEIGRRWSGLS